MMVHILKSALVSLGVGFIAEVINSWLSSEFLEKYFEVNLITILVALLAINAATLGIVLTKLRDLIDRNGGSKFFKATRVHMLLTIKEQIVLIILATFLLSIKSATILVHVQNFSLIINSIITGIFVYALMILYDTAKSVLIIIDHDC